MEGNPRATRWFLTLNNYGSEDIELIESNRFQDLCKYIIYGEEEAPSTGTKHIHLYCRLKKKMYKNTIKCMFPRAVIEVARGDEMQCYNYCSKDGKFKEFGQRLSKIDEWVSKVQKTKKMLEDLMMLEQEEFEAKYTYEAFTLKKKLEDWKFSHQKLTGPWGGELQKKNIWIYGEPGCGKSRWAHQQASEAKFYLKNVNKWWDGYNDGTTQLVIIEDFPVDNKEWLINILKIWSDRYPFNGEVKGGTVRVTPGKWILIVTSNHSIEEVFVNCQEQDVKAIKRRFTEVHMKNGNLIKWTRVPNEELQK